MQDMDQYILWLQGSTFLVGATNSIQGPSTAISSTEAHSKASWAQLSTFLSSDYVLFISNICTPGRQRKACLLLSKSAVKPLPGFLITWNSWTVFFSQKLSLASLSLCPRCSPWASPMRVDGSLSSCRSRTATLGRHWMLSSILSSHLTCSSNKNHFSSWKQITQHWAIVVHHFSYSGFLSHILKCL